MTRVLIENIRIADVATGTLREGCSVLVSLGLVQAIHDEPIEAPEALKIDGRGRALLPGLIDCKVRIASDGRAPTPWEAAETTGRFRAERVDDAPPHLDEFDSASILEEESALRTLADIKTRGFTTVRDDGGADAGVRNALDKGYVRGPRLLIGIEEIRPTGPHHSLDEGGRYRLKPQCECCRPPALDGESPAVAQVVSQCRTLLRLGADHLRVVMSRFDPRAQRPVDDDAMPTRAVELVADEAASWGRYVSAVAHAPATIVRAAAAGVRVIEFGTFIDGPSADLMAERGMFLIPSLLSHVRRVERAEASGLPDRTIDEMKRTVEAGFSSLALAREAGVRIAFGSGLSGDELTEQGRELRLLNEVLTGREVVQSATSTAASLLRLDHQIGEVREGLKAEFLLVDGDPVRDLECLKWVRQCGVDPESRSGGAA